MDGDPNQATKLIFNDFIPLSFRITFFILLGLFLWLLLNIIFFNFTRINILNLLNLSFTPHNYTQLDNTPNNLTTGEYASTIHSEFNENQRLIKGISKSFKILAVFNIVCWIAYKIINGDESLRALYYTLPVVSFAFTIYKLFYKSALSPGQFRIFTTIKRILRGNINSLSMRTNDILISDSLVSFSKVLNDLGLVIWNYWFASDIAYNYQLEFMILCIPTCIRIKQCWFEYKSTGQKQHLLNLIKYSTGFGPLLVNVMIKRTLLKATEDEKSSGVLLLKLNMLNNWWYLVSAINSTYSFIWDIKMDWNLGMLNSLFEFRNPFYKLVILRKQLAFPTIVYYFAIVTDFILRFIWVLKIFIINEELHSDKIKFIHVFSTFLFGYDAYSFGYAVIELLEIYRRWVWCFLKLESDWVKLSKHEEEEQYELEDRLPKQG
ncbi:erd1 Protein ERD1 1 [Candida maltosa Xu316]|uniref:EXS domain-containing protein n=1 Tax=Candida maltosa (strain Xu316) TaxID=1245528 RepID=M3J193_CANMX|nr:hypothetical protein G210_4208 [Candida maltosa Xu316]